MMNSTEVLLTIIMLQGDRPDPQTKGVVELAMRVSRDLGVRSAALLVGEGAAQCALDLAPSFDHLSTAEGPYEEETIIDAVLLALEVLAKTMHFRAIFIAQSATGRECAAAIAGRYDLPSLTDVQEITVSRGQCIAELRKLDGAVNTQVTIAADACVIFCVQAKASSLALASRRAGTIEALVVTRPPARIAVLDSLLQEQSEISLDTADIVISGGKGLAGPEPFTGFLRELSDEMGAALGATRAVVDAGWVSHALQIGQTGKTISPRLYFAVAISGQIQHRVGMQTSGTIVAVNKDAQAPIVGIADLVVIGDVFQIIPALTRLLREEKVHT